MNRKEEAAAGMLAGMQAGRDQARLDKRLAADAVHAGEVAMVPLAGVLGRVGDVDTREPTPESVDAMAESLEALGLRYVDAPISGGAAKAASGQMTMMTAGKPEAYALAEPFLNAMAAKVYKLGDSAGAGSKVKIINQLLAGVHIAAAAEAMALGLREGVDAAALYEVITHSAGNSWMFENRMAHVLAADYTPLSAVDIFVKDLGLVLDTARATTVPLPLASTAHQMFMQASTGGFGREDDSAVIKIFPGIELPKKSS
jgi:3-hydroxyisobutyrate dehydrogenase